MSISLNLKGRRALITGASGELGRTMALTLAKCGADVVIHYHRNLTKAKELEQQIQTLGRKAVCIQADTTREKDVQRMHDEITNLWGGIDILVINAVVQYIWKPLLEQDLADFQKQFDSTVLQAVLLCKAFVPEMITQKSGRVIAINTECTMQCLPTQSAYVAGKRGMDGVMRVLAREVGPSGVTVNQVAPGWTIGEKERANPHPYSQQYAESVPLRRRGTDTDIANAVVFLASDMASFITGAYLPVNGGNVMPTV